MPDLGRVDFRAGTLTGAGGFDSTTGAPAITTTDPPVGVYAADFDGSTEYGSLSITASPDVYTYIYVKIDSAPAGNTTLLRIRSGGVDVGGIILTPSLTLVLRNAGASITPVSDALTTGALYRIGLVQRAGTGADGVLEGWFGEAHQAMTKFAESTSESFTADADEIRAGAVTGDFDGRIGYLAADSRLMPGSWLAIHDAVLGPIGLMRLPETAQSVADLAPAYDRAAIGEARHETFQPMSFITQANFGGGAGQYRLIAQDKYLAGIGDGRFPGLYFPPRSTQNESAGGTTSYLFERGGSLYGFASSTIDVIGSASSVSYSSRVPLQQPVHDGAGFAYWADASGSGTVPRVQRFAGVSAGAPEDITPTGYDPQHVALYGTGLWCLATREVPAGATFVQEKAASSDSLGSNRVDLTLDEAPTPGNWIVVVVVGVAAADDNPVGVVADTETTGADTSVHTTTVTDTTTIFDTSNQPRTLVPHEPGWEAVPGATVSHDGANGGLHAWVYLREVTRPHETHFSFDASGDMAWYAAAIELEGMDLDRRLVDETSTSSGTGTLATSGSTGTLAQSDEFAIGFLADTNSASDIATPSGWTQVGSGYADATNLREMRVFRQNLSATTALTLSDAIASGDFIGGIVTLKGNALSAAFEQFVALYSSDYGESWTPAPSTPAIAAGEFGTIRASVAFGSLLYFTCERGLFSLRADVAETVDGERIVTTAILKHDDWDVTNYAQTVNPRGGGDPAPIVFNNQGKWIGTFEGLLYYPVGATVRRFTPGSDQGAVFWPGEDWATVVDDVQALISNEAGIWFSSAGYLWLFSGRGFFPMAAEPEDDAFDYLYSFNGRIYYKDDPAGFVHVPYPTIRPDISMDLGDIDQSDFTTGYLITSSIDFEKAADPKVIRLFESQVSFTDQASTSGTVTFHYRSGCDTDDDPGLAGGGDLSGDWTLIGEHAFADGGYKRFSFSPPLQCYRIYIRATLAPGTTGIPRLHYFTTWGASILPSVDAIVGQFKLAAGQVDKENSIIYDDPAQAQAALRALRGMRKRNEPSATIPLYHTVYLHDGSDGGREVTALFTKLEYGETYRGEDGLGYEVVVVCGFEELPQ